jgi:hypothetical protein
MSGERGSQDIGPSLPIHVPGNVLSRHALTCRPQWGGAPSCSRMVCGLSVKFVVLRTVASCPGRRSRWSSALEKSHHFTNNWLRNVKMAAYSICPHKKKFHSFTIICRKPHVASAINLRVSIFQNPQWTLWTHCIIFQCCMKITEE